MDTMHGPFLKPQQYACKVVDCACKYASQQQLNTHIVNFHQKNITEDETLLFKNFKEFFRWKFLEEERTYSRYLKSGEFLRRTKGKPLSTQFYFCYHRMKLNKCNGVEAGKAVVVDQKDLCAAQIMLRISAEGFIAVSYKPRHRGHELDAKSALLPYNDRIYIAGLLSMNLSYETILRTVQQTLLTLNRPMGSRVHYLSNLDLDQIAKEFGIIRAFPKNNIAPVPVSFGELRQPPEVQLVNCEVRSDFDIPSAPTVEIPSSVNHRVNHVMPKVSLACVSSEKAVQKKKQKNILEVFETFKHKAMDCVSNDIIQTVTEKQEEILTICVNNTETFLPCHPVVLIDSSPLYEQDHYLSIKQIVKHCSNPSESTNSETVIIVPVACSRSSAVNLQSDQNFSINHDHLYGL